MDLSSNGATNLLNKKQNSDVDNNNNIPEMVTSSLYYSGKDLLYSHIKMKVFCVKE